DLYNKPGNANALVGYTSGSQADRWRAAKDAAYDIIETNLYSLYDKSEDPSENYANIFLDKTSEVTIFAKLFNKELLGTSHDLYNGPNGYNNWGGMFLYRTWSMFIKWRMGPTLAGAIRHIRRRLMKTETPALQRPSCIMELLGNNVVIMVSGLILWV